MSNTLPERLVSTIKDLIKAHDEFRKEIEEFQALSGRIQSELDRLVARKDRLDTIGIESNSLFKLPRGITPDEKPVADIAS